MESVKFLTKAPRHYNFGSSECLRKLNHVRGKIDTRAPQKDLAVLFFRKDCSSRSSFRDRSTDNFAFESTHLRKPQSCTNRESQVLATALRKQKSEYSICTICALKKKKQKCPSIAETTTSEESTTEENAEQTDSTDTDQFHECISNIYSMETICSQKRNFSSVEKVASGDLNYRNHLMLSRETQTSFTFTDAGSTRTEGKGYDRALKIYYGKRNYLSYQNLFHDEEPLSSVMFSKEDTDEEEEYIINCLDYNSPAASYSCAHQEIRKMPTNKSNSIKYPTLARSSKKPMNKTRIVEPETILEKLRESAKIRSKARKQKSVDIKEKSTLSNMHSRALSFMKNVPKFSKKEKDSCYKIKLLEMTGNEIMGQNFGHNMSQKRKTISNMRNTLKQKNPLLSFNTTSSTLARNSTYIIGCYQKPAVLSTAPSVKIKMKKTRKLKA